MSYTVSEDWIIGVFGVLVMVFFIGCTNCWQNKSPDPAGRRQPPSPPTPGLEARYEHSMYPPTPLSDTATQHSGHKNPRAGENEEDSEEDFEEVEILSEAQKSHVNGQNSAASRKTAEESEARRDTYANLESEARRDTYANLDAVRCTEHVYVKIIASDPELDATSAYEDKEEHKTPRSAINSIGKYSSHSGSLCHSYENVAVGSSPVGSDFDYVNMSSPPPV
ncbi:uncharacterized protein [Eleutherodactylus coqui]|uniref:uncharacterized protein isoform X2 n=1 Tax=Eleutherodactylus coqui TaxID=57060 RepID=UPI0034625236